MRKSLRILIVEPSPILRSGVAAVLRQIEGFNIHIAEPESTPTPELAAAVIASHQPDILVVSPAYLGQGSPVLQQLRSKRTVASIVALLCTPADPMTLRDYDAEIGLYDTPAIIADKLSAITHNFPFSGKSDANTGKITSPQESSTETLTSREKEIISYIAKGFTNKQIADKLFLSAHTVITHRRNIAAKLQIHSPAGLTIYAVVNKLVALDEI